MELRRSIKRHCIVRLFLLVLLLYTASRTRNVLHKFKLAYSVCSLVGVSFLIEAQVAEQETKQTRFTPRPRVTGTSRKLCRIVAALEH